jgi:hypothetical protein
LNGDRDRRQFTKKQELEQSSTKVLEDELNEINRVRMQNENHVTANFGILNLQK